MHVISSAETLYNSICLYFVVSFSNILTSNNTHSLLIVSFPFACLCPVCSPLCNAFLAILLIYGHAMKASCNGTELSARKQKERLKLCFLSCCQGNTSAAYHPARGYYFQIFGLDQCEDLKRYYEKMNKSSL